ncbi:MAG: hypothetical protein HDR80_01140 [Bacteroides sp.]|nr:hypothetical protein [Bacteroides sp.]
MKHSPTTGASRHGATASAGNTPPPPERSPKMRRLLDSRPSWAIRHGSLALLLLFAAIAAITAIAAGGASAIL